MKINKLTATFGKFQNESISFHQGLNIIYAPNESGKTTWCAFIMAMLYGIDSSERSKNGILPVKRKYEPWSGMPMEGRMDLTADKCDITLSRTTRLKSAPMREFSAFYSGTGIPVDGMTGLNAGEQLTGVSKDVFAKSAFIGQGASAVTNSPDMEKRIQSILSTGEEEVSVSEADARLGAWLRKRRYSQSGLLPKTEAKIEELTNTLSLADDMARAVCSEEKQLSECEEECAKTEYSLVMERRRYRKKIMQEISAAREDVRKLSENQNNALEELYDRRSELQRSIFKRRSMEEVEADAEKDLSELQRLEASGRIGLIWIPAVLCFLISLFGVYYYQHFNSFVQVLVLSAVFCAAAILLFVIMIRKLSYAEESRKKSEKILRKYRVLNADDITIKLDEYHSLCIGARKAEEKEAAASKALNEAYRKLAELESKAAEEMDLFRGNSRVSALGKELKSQRNRASELAEDIADKKGRLAVIGDPVALRSEIRRLEKKRDQIQKEYEEIELARAVLKEANEEVQRDFAPELGKLATEYMSYVTGGRYEGVLLNRNFTALAKTKDDAVAREAEYLSTGTSDLLYLAVRLAFCELAFPDSETCPLILDDALNNMDDKRYEQAMRLLGEIAKERQVILFTCRQ